MPGLFTDLNRQLQTAKRKEEQTLITARIYEELDKMKDALDKAATPQSPGANRPPGAFSPTGPSNNTTSPTVTREDAEATTFEVAIASGEIILPDQVVSLRLASNNIVIAYLSNAANTERRADAVAVGTVYRGGEKRLICKRRGQMRVRMSIGAMPTNGTELFVSAVTPGALTDNTSESPSRKFSQRVATYLYQAKNKLGELQPGVAWAEVDLSPAASLPAAASV